MGQVVTCPLCRVPLGHIVKDKQFDAVVQALSLHTPAMATEGCQPLQSTRASPSALPINIDFSGGNFPGVCMRGHNGPGVLVSMVHKEGEFYIAGIRPDDLVLEINGVCNYCPNHRVPDHPCGAPEPRVRGVV